MHDNTFQISVLVFGVVLFAVLFGIIHLDYQHKVERIHAISQCVKSGNNPVRCSVAFREQ